MRDCERVDSVEQVDGMNGMGEREREWRNTAIFLAQNKRPPPILHRFGPPHISQRGNLPFLWTQVHVTVAAHIGGARRGQGLHLCDEMGPSVGEQTSSRVPCRSTRRTTIPADTRQDWLATIDSRSVQRLWVPGMSWVVKKDEKRASERMVFSLSSLHALLPHFVLGPQVKVDIPAAQTPFYLSQPS